MFHVIQNNNLITNCLIKNVEIVHLSISYLAIYNPIKILWMKYEISLRWSKNHFEHCNMDAYCVDCIAFISLS